MRPLRNSGKKVEEDENPEQESMKLRQKIKEKNKNKYNPIYQYLVLNTNKIDIHIIHFDS